MFTLVPAVEGVELVGSMEANLKTKVAAVIKEVARTLLELD